MRNWPWDQSLDWWFGSGSICLVTVSHLVIMGYHGHHSDPRSPPELDRESHGTLKSLFHWLWVTGRVVTVFIYRSAAPGRKNVRAESSARPMKSWNMVKCSNPFFQSANSHIIIIKPPVEAVLLLLICKFFIQIPQIMSTKTSPSTVIHS